MSLLLHHDGIKRLPLRPPRTPALCAALVLALLLSACGLTGVPHAKPADTAKAARRPAGVRQSPM
jgi:ABC-type uncharacterized transport system auxiliary subunit